MNTDKLMELERKWRKNAERERDYVRETLIECADELAAALRAEQAVGDEQIARELLAEEMEPTYSTTAKRLRDPEFPTDGFPTATQAGVRAIRRALGAARQPEGVVFGVTKVDRDFRWDREKMHFVPLLTVEFEPVLPIDGYDAKGWKDRDSLAAMLAAAPGGEGEVDK